jgi:L-threonylcarbamoyladenylate synthase
VQRLPDWDAAADLLATGGVVLLPTDTLPGLHCRADLPEAVQRLVDLKRRVVTKPFLLLCGSALQALDFTTAPDSRAIVYARHCWPGPFTLIFPAGPEAPTAVTAGLPTVALRVPEPLELRRLVTAAGFALVSTSANLPGRPPTPDLEVASKLFATQVDGVLTAIPDWQPVASSAQASTLIDLTTWPPRMLRKGVGKPPDWLHGSAPGR